jgi:hypothetical protein
MGKILSGLNFKRIVSQDVTTDASAYIFNLLMSATSGASARCVLYNENDDITDGFNVIGGKIYEYNTGKFIYGIRAEESNKIALILSGNNTNYYINDSFILNNNSYIESRNKVKGIVVETSGCYVDLDFEISGGLPSYQFSGFRFSGNETTGSGYVINSNPSREFRIYSGISESGLYVFQTDSGDVTSTKSFNVTRMYELQNQAELSDNTTEYAFTIYSNFGVFDESIEITTIFPVVQTLSSFPIISFSGIDTGAGYFTWSNYKGQDPYSSPLSAKLKIRYLSGVSGGNSFNSIFNASISEMSPTVFFPMNYNPSITGYEYTFSTTESDGLQYKIGRAISGQSMILNIDYSGYNTGFNYNITGL